MVQNKNIPQGYKDSPLGRIPEEWEVKRLGEISKISSGGTPLREKREYWNGDIPWITTSLLHTPKITIVEEYISKKGLESSATKLLPPQTLIMAMYGQGKTRGTIAKLMISAATNQACAAIIIKKQSVDYIFYLLDNKYDYIRSLSNDGNQKNLSLGIIGEIKIPLPPFPEQQKIAKILTCWDDAIEKQARLIEKLETRKRGLMQQLLSGKKRLKGFEGKWVKYSYKDVLKTVQRNMPWEEEKQYELISVKRRSGGLFLREPLFGYQIKTKKLRPAHEGDFLISKMQVIHGASGLTTKEFHGKKISDSYIAVISKNDLLNIKFLNWKSQMPYFYHQTYISSYGVHIEKMTFDFNTFMSLSIKIPSIEEQTAIVDILSTADEEIQKEKEKLTALKLQKKGLMQVLLTGRKRVKI